MLDLPAGNILGKHNLTLPPQAILRRGFHSGPSPSSTHALGLKAILLVDTTISPLKFILPQNIA